MMILQKPYILVRKFLAVHIFHPVGKYSAVKAYEVLLRKFSDKSSKILLLDIGIRIILASCRSILCLAVLNEEVEMITNFAIFAMPLTIKHICLCNSIILLCHQTDLNLILNFLNMHAFCDSYMRENIYDILFRCKCSN